MYPKRTMTHVSICASVLMTITFFVNPAFATCGSANCFLNSGTQNQLFSPGQIVMDLSYRYIPQDRKLRGSDTTNEVLVPKVNFESGVLEPGHHREIRTQNSLAELDIGIGVTQRLTLNITLPFYNDRYHEHDDGVGELPILGGPGEFVNTDGTSGFGDIAVNGRYAFLTTLRHQIVGGLGIKLPTGEYQLKDRDGNINEPTIMPGTGSYDYLVSAAYTYQWKPHRLSHFISFQYRLNIQNDLDYELGDAVVLNIGSNFLVTDKLTLSAQLNGRTTDRDRYKGASVSNTGSTMVYLTPGVSIQASHKARLYGFFQVPVYQYVNESNLAPSYGLQFGFSYSLE